MFNKRSQSLSEQFMQVARPAPKAPALLPPLVQTAITAQTALNEQRKLMQTYAKHLPAKLRSEFKLWEVANQILFRTTYPLAAINALPQALWTSPVPAYSALQVWVNALDGYATRYTNDLGLTCHEGQAWCDAWFLVDGADADLFNGATVIRLSYTGAIVPLR
jgi:hypothetical protein